MDLLSNDALEGSAVVANCRMNRERDLAGSNGYGRELGFHPLDHLLAAAARHGRAAWLDLCCGTGRALIAAARQLRDQGVGKAVAVVGVDLAGLFDPLPPGLEGLRLVEAPLRHFEPVDAFDLVTCVHGLHYVGDKLGVVARAASWLTVDGVFAANLDLGNFKFPGDRPAGRSVAAALRACGVEYDRRRRLVRCHGKKEVTLPFRYLGADDRAGPNCTGQPAVNSYYEPRAYPPDC
jgi:SAM-dependent methyltransferase